MSGYCFFKNTGVKEIDDILDVIHNAGNAYHSTEYWGDESDYRDDGKSYIDLIQDAANDAAERIKRLNTKQ